MPKRVKQKLSLKRETNKTLSSSGVQTVCLTSAVEEEVKSRSLCKSTQGVSDKGSNLFPEVRDITVYTGLQGSVGAGKGKQGGSRVSRVKLTPPLMTRSKRRLLI
jgi:hypothetical protein